MTSNQHSSHVETLRNYIKLGGYEIVTMADGNRSAVPADDKAAMAALDGLVEQLEALQTKTTSLFAGYSATCERWSLGTCDVYPEGELCRICQFFTDLGYESFEVTSGGLRSWKERKDLDPTALDLASNPASEPEGR